MASGSSPTAPGGPPPLSERRIVLLGKAGAGKNRVASVILGDTKLKEECEQCVLYEDEQAGRRIRIVDTPGWDRVSIECTTKKIKNEIIQSVARCPPGPHALILVLPVKTGDVPSLNELKSASQHMELLSERVWDHTMVLFLCDEDVEESAIKEHILKAEKLLEKCRGRHYVVRQSESETLIHGLLQEIDNMVKENQDEFFLPQVYYEVMQSKMVSRYTPTETNKNPDEEKPEEKVVLRQRRGSIQGGRPNLTKQTEDSERQRERTETKKCTNEEQLPWNYIKPVVVILMAFMGALVGAVSGAQYGTLGAVVGLVVGFILLMLISLWLVSLIT